MSQSINIVKLIEENPNTKLSKSYQGKLINKLKDSFSTDEQQLFISSFYCYLNYKSNDFVVDFDDIWKWLGFTRKDNAKTVLERHFIKDVNYQIKNIFPAIAGKGRPSEKIMLNIKTFKKMCLKANTSKANEIHEYYIKLEETLHEVIDEESNELRLQLEEKENIIEAKENIIEETSKKLEAKETIIEETKEELIKITKKYVKPPKEVIEDKNVVYLMTTEESQKVGEYVVGKATDLNNRKEDYNHNKLHDFKIVFYISFENSKLMDIIEASVLMKLGKYRCKAGRDVFLLPGSDISIFINIFNECAKFYGNVLEEHVVYAKRTPTKNEEQKEKNAVYQMEHYDEIREKQREYREINADVINEVNREKYAENPEKILERNKKYYEKNREELIESAKEYYYDRKEEILEERKEFYKDNKEHILEERKEYYKENYKTKIAVKRQAKETCECGMIVTHYCMKNHQKSERHRVLMEKLSRKGCDGDFAKIVIVDDENEEDS